MGTYAAGRAERRPAAFVFPSASGRKLSDDNVRNRVLASAVERANEALEENGSAPLPDRVTPHSLRRTYASILIASGEDPLYAARQMGHSTPHLTMTVYARVMERRDGEPERLRALVAGEPLAAPTERAGEVAA